MELDKQQSDYIIKELSITLKAKPDGGGKNLIASNCPFCGKSGKYGVYIGKDTDRKKRFMSHCFSCGKSTLTLPDLLTSIDRTDLIPTETADIEAPLVNVLVPLEDQVDEIDDSLNIIELPEFYRRVFHHPYLFKRGFDPYDYEYFEVGTTRGLNFKFENYIILPIIDDGEYVGYVARHIWPKDDIDTYNITAKKNGVWQIRRYNNSIENDFVKLFYNYDAIIEDVTKAVVIVEGAFDVVPLYRKLNLYDQNEIAVVATFGKKISNIQIYKLQAKGVETVVLGYDGDAVEATKKVSSELSKYFDTWILDIPDASKDWEDLEFWDIYDIFSEGLRSPLDYKLNKVQELK